jgi:hypothetical protein
LIVGILILGLLILNLTLDGVWIIQGLNGTDGEDGKDGIDGVDGIDGENGKNGVDGVNGKSAYELAVEDGFRGSLHEWLLSLAVRGTDGANGKPGTDGVGVKDVRINAQGYLIVTLTDGSVITAGHVGGSGDDFVSEEPDEDGFYEVYETVVLENVEASLNLRLTPDTQSGEVFTSIVKGTELLRVGDQRTPEGFSRFLYNGTYCYARSKFFELKYVYEGELPTVNLPERVVLTKGETHWFITDQICPDRTDDLHFSYSYSGSGKTADEVNNAISSIRGDLLEIRATIELDPTSPEYSAGISVRYNPNVVNGVTERTDIIFSNTGVYVERNQSTQLDYVNTQPSYTWGRVKTTYEITILVDRSMLEVYVDGVISFTTRIYPKYGDSDYLAVFDNNANIKFTELTIYRMGSAYSDTVTPPYYGNVGNLGD